MESILTTIKKMLGITEDYEHFDVDIIIHINTALFKLNQLGVGPETTFSIKGKDEVWSDFIQTSPDLESVKAYIYLNVRLVFDTPTPSYVAEAMKAQAEEIGWRLNIQSERSQNGSENR